MFTQSFQIAALKECVVQIIWGFQLWLGVCALRKDFWKLEAVGVSKCFWLFVPWASDTMKLGLKATTKSVFWAQSPEMKVNSPFRTKRPLNVFVVHTTVLDWNGIALVASLPALQQPHRNLQGLSCLFQP